MHRSETSYLEDRSSLETSEPLTQPLAQPQVAALLAAGDWKELAVGLGFAHCGAKIPAEAFLTWGLPADLQADLRQLEVLAAGPGYRLMLVQGDVPYAALRRAILAVHRRNPAELTMWWSAGECEVTMAIVDARADLQPFVRRMVTRRDRPDPVGLRQWTALGIQDLAAPDIGDRVSGLVRHMREVLNQDGLTREFFRGFAGALEVLKERMEAGPAEDRDRHDVALSTLLRLVFIYFLQLKGALDGDARFIVRNLRQARADGRSFYQSVLRPLFFGVLNRPRDERDAACVALGVIPFLNGGLFEPLPAEVATPNMDWDDEVWSVVIEGLLERFHFAIDTDTTDECRAVDPEMLGKVFEGLMYGESRHSSGSYYTPRDVVRKMVEEALVGYLVDHTNLGPDAAQRVVSGQAGDLGREVLEGAARALEGVRILDPAVGTGAFLLEALHILKRCFEGLKLHGVRVRSEATAINEYTATRELIHNHLFGVDIQQTAVRLCELRLWLAMLATLEPVIGDDGKPDIGAIPALPNLSHRVCAGNSLLSPLDLISLRAAPGAGSTKATGAWGGSASRLLRQHLHEMATVRRAFLTAHGDDKADLRAAIEGLQSRMHLALLDARRAYLTAQLEPLRELGASKDLFGKSMVLNAAQQAAVSTWQAELDGLDVARDDVQSSRTRPLSFCYETSFEPVAEREGFDIIVTNPPWVRAHRIDPGLKHALKARYRCYGSELWPGAAALGVRAPYGAQVDLAALFVERSLELLRPQGRLCALLPSKLFRSLHGAGLRDLLHGQRVVAIEDFSDADRRMFEATTYPAMLHVQNTPPAPQDDATQITVWHGESKTAWQAPASSLAVLDGEPGEPWMFVEPQIQEIFRRIRADSTPLGALESMQPQRGVLTGCNDIFVISQARAQALLGDDFEEWSRPALMGREIRSWSIEDEMRILWPYDDKLNVRADLPAPLERYFHKHRRRLEARSDHRDGQPLWQLFRVRDGLLRPKVVWRDLAPQLESAVAPAQMIALNTVYFIACQDEARARAIAGLFNSAPMRAITHAIAERAHSGWRRHFAWVMRMLPVPARFAEWIEGRGEPVGAKVLDDAGWAEIFGIDLADLHVLADWQHAAGNDDTASDGAAINARVA